MYRSMKPVQKICLAAMLCALSCVIAYVCKLFTLWGVVRFTFESLPLIITGILFGPWWGFGCGMCADLLNTALSSYGIGAINPIVTLGEALIGLSAGFIFNYCLKKGNQTIRVLVSTLVSHIVGNIIVKTVGLWLYYPNMRPFLFVRIPTYIIIAGIEFSIILVLFRSRVFSSLQKESKK